MASNPDPPLNEESTSRKKPDFHKFVDKVKTNINKVGDKLEKTFAKVGDKIEEKYTITKTKIGEKYSETKAKIEEKKQERKRFKEEVEQEMHKLEEHSKSESEEIQWQDLSHDAFMKHEHTDDHINSHQTSQKESNIISSPQLDASNKLMLYEQTNLSQSKEQKTQNLDGETVLHLFDDDMRLAYTEAQHCIEDGQETMALQYFNYIIQLANKKGLSEIVEFIEKKKQLY